VKNAPGDERERLADIAHLYYRERMTQQEIARSLGISRSMVSRLLDKSLQKGIVEIVIHYPGNRNHDLERQLTRRFGVEDIRVAATRSGSRAEERFAAGCALAAQYILSLLRQDTVMAVAWGRAVAGVLAALATTKRYPGVKVVQPFGSALPNQSVDGTAIIGGLAAKLGGKAVYLHVPLHVGNEQTRNMLLNDPQIGKVVSLAAKADFIVTGIGDNADCGGGDDAPREPFWNNYLARAERRKLLARGSVGHIFTRHFDIDGRLLEMDEYNGIVGLSNERYLKIPLRIAVAMGREKAPGMVGALRGGFINSLVTDDRTAREIVKTPEA
jgi:DNA-binding transcriptional regulator LsrR (DeoR family)